MMRTFSRSRAAASIICAFLAAGASAQSWSDPISVTDDRGSGGDLGKYNSMVVANGNPAVATMDRSHSRLVWLRATDAGGSAWNPPVTILPPGVHAHHLSVAIVNGNPAIAYCNGPAGFASEGLMFVRANDPNGDTWGTPVLVDGTPDAGQQPELKVVNGKPAIVYQYIPFNTVHRYVQAADSDGQTWSTPVQITVIATPSSAPASLEVVNGHPAVAYRSLSDVTYRRALDADGVAWDNPVTIAAGANPGLFNLRVIGGVPCVAYQSQGAASAKFHRANDADGMTWSGANDIPLAPVLLGLELFEADGYPAVVFHSTQTTTLEYRRACNATGTQWLGCGANGATIETVSTVDLFLSAGIVNGYPAVAYSPSSSAPYRLKYCSASATTGLAWNAPITISARPKVGLHTTQCFVSGHPALAYYDESNKDLRYIRANDPLGQTWGTSVTIDSVGDVGSFCSMQSVNGKPAISYYDATNNLKYVRASDAIGSAWSAPIPLFATGATYGQGTSLAVVAGRPAIAFANNSNGQLWYIRALDADGAAWPATSSYMFSSSTSPSLIDLAGVPAVAFTYTSGQDLYFIRGANADGTAWAVQSVVDDVGVVGLYPSLINLAGNPAISYWDQTNTKFKYAYANSPLGISWAKTTLDDDGNTTAYYSSLTVIDGAPACAYRGFSTNIIRIKRAVNATGTNWSAAPINITALGSQLSHITMVPNGNDAGISYCDPVYGTAYYISGAQCGLGTPAPTNTTPPEDMIACSGTPTTLSVSGSNVTWTYFGDVVGTGNSYTTPAVFVNPTFVATDSACYISTFTNVTVTINTVDAGVTAADDSLTADATGVLYQWLDCNNGLAPIPGATDQVFSGPAGVYAVEITDGACVDTSACVALINTLADAYDDPRGALIYPNPAARILNILAGAGGPVEASLLDADGRVVRLLSNAPQAITLDVGDLGRGCYLLKLVTANSSTFYRVVLE